MSEAHGVAAVNQTQLLNKYPYTLPGLKLNLQNRSIKVWVKG